jgi:hypothetical protein
MRSTTAFMSGGENLAMKVRGSRAAAPVAPVTVTRTRSENSPAPAPIDLSSTPVTASLASSHLKWRKHVVHHSAVTSSRQHATLNGTCAPSGRQPAGRQSLGEREGRSGLNGVTRQRSERSASLTVSSAVSGGASALARTHSAISGVRSCVASASELASATTRILTECASIMPGSMSRSPRTSSTITLERLTRCTLAVLEEDMLELSLPARSRRYHARRGLSPGFSEELLSPLRSPGKLLETAPSRRPAVGAEGGGVLLLSGTLSPRFGSGSTATSCSCMAACAGGRGTCA